MTNTELINTIIALYKKAKESKRPAENIIRGRGHTISSEVEDLIAYLFSQLTDASIVIDKSFSIQLNGRRKTIYPDIAIIKDDTVTSFFDVKMDLGWKSEFPSYCIEKSEMIKQIRGQQVKLWKKNDYHVLLDDKLNYEIIVISEKNISKKLLKETIYKIAQANIRNEVSIYFLTSKVHPNDENAKGNIEINHEQLDELRERIKMI